ncbi:uncharacterized protein LOC124144440 [Haliotis rufescens]|uniref:uncharacterized protein LOC124144440 n=1 Tax=Haliotis rufescens TaxID=6454 RepID=UPI00201F42E2|nr:uncharacterized protein LOC124144440 [Haliotis rufescens]
MIILQHLCLAPILAAIFSVVVATPCEPRVFIPWSDYNDKKPTTGIHVQSLVSSRMMCLRACFVANHTRSVFYTASTLTCYCAYEPPSSLNLEDEAGTECIQPMGTVETWMTSVIGVSSEFGVVDPRFLATQMLGPPDVYPNYGDLTGTWCANFYDDKQWIELAISEPMFVDQVYIYETYHAGGLQNLSVRDTANSWHLVWTTPNIVVIPHSRIFAPDFQSPSFQVTGFRLHVDMTVANGWVQMDAMLAVGRK